MPKLNLPVQIERGRGWSWGLVDRLLDASPFPLHPSLDVVAGVDRAVAAVGYNVVTEAVGLILSRVCVGERPRKNAQATYSVVGNKNVPFSIQLGNL